MAASFDGRLAEKMVVGNATALLNQRQGEAFNIAMEEKDTLTEIAGIEVELTEV
jgi:hypothetical protein